MVDTRPLCIAPPLSALLTATSAVQQHGLPLMLMLCGLPPVVDNLSRSKSYSERMFTTLVLGTTQPEALQTLAELGL